MTNGTVYYVMKFVKVMVLEFCRQFISNVSYKTYEFTKIICSNNKFVVNIY